MTSNELLGLLRREHGRRLVEDEDVGLPIERLEDLDALPDADRQVLDRGHQGRRARPCCSESSTIRRSRGADGRACRAARCVDSTPSMMFSVTVKTGIEHEVLVDHADAGRDGVARAAEVTGVVVDQDLALVRLVEAVEDVHEGRLAGAVLAEQGEDLAGLHDEIDALVGDDAGEALGDPPQLQLHCGWLRNR